MKPTANPLVRMFTIAVLMAMFASPAWPQSAVQAYNGHDAAANEVLIKFQQAPPDDVQAQAVIAAAIQQEETAADIDSSQGVGSAGWMVLHSRSKDVTTLMSVYTGAADAIHVEPNWVVRATSTPTDPHFTQEWGLQNTGQIILGVAGTPGADIGAASAWNISPGSRAIVVGVVDSGIDYNHPDLAANIWSAPSPFYFYQGTTQLSCGTGTHGFNVLTNACDPMDDYGHGTHVSGTIGAVGNNGVGVAGVNWTTSIIGCKFLDLNGNGTTAGAVNCLQFMEGAKAWFGGKGGAADIRVLNNSWLAAGGDQSLLDEINNTYTADMLFPAAAGNTGSDNDVYPVYPASYGAPNIIAVAATDNQDYLASTARGESFSSNYGALTVQVGGPGVNVYSTCLTGGLCEPDPSDPNYGWLSGTSMATPHVSGAAALSLSVCQFDTDFLRANLLSNVVVIPALEGVTVTGGRVNAYKSLNVAASACPGTGWGAISGSTDKHKRVCDYPGDCWIVWDSGYVSITVNGNTKSVNYSEWSTPQSLANSLYSAINTDPNQVARAHLSGSNVSLSAKRTGSDTCYTLSVSSGSNDPEDFPTPSFSASASGPALAGCR